MSAILNFSEARQLIHAKLKKSRWNASAKLAILAGLMLSLTSCEIMGPRALRNGRADYNDAIKSTEVEQFLLNIVRMRYNDRPFVLEISSISSRVEAGGSASVAGGQSDRIDGLTYAQAGARLSYLEKPTIVYQPLKGRDFTRQLLRPVDLNTLLMLRESGWELDDIFRVFVGRINGIPNANTGASSTPEGVPEFREFLQVVEAMDEIEDSGSLELARSATEKKTELLVRVRKEARDSKNFREFIELLRLDPDVEFYRIRLGLDDGGGKEIVIRTRSILASMFFVGQSVQVPEEDIRAGNVHINYDDNGAPFDWRLVHDDLIRIYSSADRPKNVYAAVQYGKYWYYVENSDINSKETLTMLGIVFTLNAGGSSQAPILTIPVD
jgi:hypothetical protein